MKLFPIFGIQMDVFKLKLPCKILHSITTLVEEGPGKAVTGFPREEMLQKCLL